MIIYEDNQSTISMAKDPQFQNTSLSNIILFESKFQMKKLKYCKTNNIIADVMTKGLTGEHFEK